MTKKKYISKLTGLLICAAIMLSVAVGGITMFNKTETASAEVGEINTFNEFLVGGGIEYYSPEVTSIEDQTRDIVRSGMNWLDCAGVTVFENLNYSEEDWNDLNDLCRELEIYFAYTDSLYESAEQAANTVRNLDRCINYFVKDEPSAAQFTSVASTCRGLYELDSTRFTYVNLFPNYAGASNLGGSYEDYIRGWVEAAGDTLEYLYFDHYPFTQYESVRASYFSDVETIRKVAWENNRLKTGGFTQMGWWNGMRRPTPAEARWSMNSLVTYGIKAISHYCWVSPPYTAEGSLDFVLQSDGTPTELYDPMQKLNWQTRQLGPVLMSFDVAHAYHSGDIPTGTEELPKSFLLQPSMQSDNLIFSLGYTKDDSENYLMLFNKELTGSKKYTIKADLSSGLTSLTWYKPDSFDVLPDCAKPLAAPKEITIDVSSGSFEVELQAGEMRLYKLNGDISIREPLKSPTLSHKSGTYLGQQTVTLSSYDEGAQIYYTTDGSYPTYRSTRYTQPITIGEDGELGFYDIRAIAVRGSEISDAVIGQYIISDGAQNVALGKKATFTGETEIFQGVTDADSVTDGNFDPHNTWGTPAGKPCFAVVDFGKEYSIDKVVVKAWHDWWFDDVVVQLSTSADFSSGVYTVFNNDTDNSVGAGVGTDGSYTENPSGGHEFKLSTPVRARYIRFHNAASNGNRSMWEEIQAYTAYNKGTELINQSTLSSDWRVTGGGTWQYKNGAVCQTDSLDRDHWDRSYTYTAKKYKNFLLEGRFTMRTSDPNAWGYVGFGLYKPQIDNVQSNYNKGYYAVIEPRGRVLLWNGAKPELGPEDANVAGFTLGAEFTFRVISIDDTISISVNGRPAMYVQNEIFDREAGYISIHGGLVPVDVSSVKITELGESDKPIEGQNCIKGSIEENVAVELYTSKADVIASLPKSVTATDTAGNRYELPVKWRSTEYDSTQTGWCVFSGEFTSVPSNLVNYNNVAATANVFVKPKLDNTEINALIARAKKVNPAYYTAESYEAMRQKLEAAETVVSDPFSVLNAISVVQAQLLVAIEELESTIDKSELGTAIASATFALQNNSYTEISKNSITSALNKAQSVYDDVVSTPDDIVAATTELNKAVRDGVTVIKTEGITQKPSIYKGKSGGCGGAASASIPAAGGIILCMGAGLVLKRKYRIKERE